MRDLSTALGNELDRSVGRIGYLIQVSLTPTKRWSNIGDVTWNALLWEEASFSVTGLDFTADSELKCTVTFADQDGVIKALFGNPSASMQDLTVTVYQFAAGALSALDVPLIATMAVDACTITGPSVTLELTEQNTDAQYSPRRRIAPSEGFNFATAAGEVIRWGNEQYTVEPSDS